MLNDSTPKVALITGASSGIGRAYSRHLASQGYKLILVSKDIRRLNSISEELSSSTMLKLAIDLSQRDGVEFLITKIPVPEIIIANAGITLSSEVGRTSKEDRDSLYYLLSGGVIDLLEDLVPKMKREKRAYRYCFKHWRSYSYAEVFPLCECKAAIARYGDSLAQELRGTGIQVTVSLPGYVRTDAHNRAGLGHLNTQIPNWMWLTPEQTVTETERASLRAKTLIVPGKVYRYVRPFLGSAIASAVWQRLTSRRRSIKHQKKREQ